MARGRLDGLTVAGGDEGKARARYAAAAQEVRRLTRQLAQRNRRIAAMLQAVAP